MHPKTSLLARLCLLALASPGRAQTTTTTTIPPTLSLSWGQYPATTYTSDTSIYKFHNVRFGAVPTRFSTPISPTTTTNPEPSGEIACYQVYPSDLKPTSSSSSAAAPTSPPGRPGPPGLLLPGENVLSETEDCLFLDIYAPVGSFDSQGKVNPDTNLPVIVWIYGGAYMFGSKCPNPDFPLYSGESLLRAMGYKAIFVTGNYRLGAFGWLAGSHMESEATPNAGLYDQALLFRWVQNYIAQVGGNSSRVSVWGQSAGASSILHHLIRQNGGDNYDPGFQTFLTQSPAYEWQWDNSPGGSLDRAVLSFQSFSNCSSTQFNLTCLRAQDGSVLEAANKQFSSLAYSQTHEFSVGPAVDGAWITKLPTLLLHEGSYFKGISAAIISHVGDEPYSFTPQINNSAEFSSYLSTYFPGSTFSNIRGSIASQTSYQASHYPGTHLLYKNGWRKALSAVIRDSSFVCNARLLYDAFALTAARVYVMEYNFPKEDFSFHGGDLAPLFMNDADDAYTMISTNWPSIAPMPTSCLHSLATDLWTGVAPAIQSFLGAFAAAGTPTHSSTTGVSAWPTASTSGSNLASVMQVSCQRGLPNPKCLPMLIPKCTPFFTVTADDLAPSDVCGFWISIASQVSASANPTTTTSTAAFSAGGGGAQPAVMVTKMPSAEEVQERLDL